MYNMNETVQIGQTNVLLLDLVGLIYFFAIWSGYSHFAQIQYARTPNLMQVMDEMRTKWMFRLLERQNRIADASLVGNLLRSISFFANTSIFILIGLITVLGYRDSALEMLNDVPFVVPTGAFMWELKVFTLAVIFIYAFFKFTWSLRQYNYCCILVGAAPMPDEDRESHASYAHKASRVITNASKHFNMGMRAYYFGLATMSWFLHPLLFICITTLVVAITYRREFRSHTLLELTELSHEK